MEPHRNHPNTCKSYLLLTFWSFPLTIFPIPLQASILLLFLSSFFLHSRFSYDPPKNLTQRSYASWEISWNSVEIYLPIDGNMSTSKMLMAFFLLSSIQTRAIQCGDLCIRYNRLIQQPRGEQNLSVCEAYEPDFLRSLNTNIGQSVSRSWRSLFFHLSWTENRRSLTCTNASRLRNTTRLSFTQILHRMMSLVHLAQSVDDTYSFEIIWYLEWFGQGF